jgi:hypothetical protein
LWRAWYSFWLLSIGSTIAVFFAFCHQAIAAVVIELVTLILFVL